MTPQDGLYNLMELMVCVAARQLEDGKTAVIGTGMPLAAAMLAQKTRAPNLILLFEAGSAAPQLVRLPVSVADSCTQTSAILHGSMNEIMEMCQRGLVDYTFLGGAQIDMYGNLNSTMMGTDLQRPRYDYRAAEALMTWLVSAGRHSSLRPMISAVLCRDWTF